MVMVIFKSSIVKPGRDNSGGRKRKVSGGSPLSTAVSTNDLRAENERVRIMVVVVVVMISRNSSFHIDQRNQPIVFVDEIRPSCSCRRIHCSFFLNLERERERKEREKKSEKEKRVGNAKEWSGVL